MKKLILSALILCGGLVSFNSCTYLSQFWDEMTEGSTPIHNAQVTSASIIKYQKPTSVNDLGIKRTKGSANVDEYLGNDEGYYYQNITVSGGGVSVSGKYKTDGSHQVRIGDYGTLYIGNTTKAFKSFEPSSY